ncbi:MAG: hypothetical protein ACFFAV_16600 [Candidatus Hermodarchaeota archaeon]
MGAGKVFCIIGGILALLAMFVFTLYNNIFVGIGSGYGIFINFVNTMQSGNIIAIIFTILFAISTISGIFIIIGVKSRIIAIIGAIFVLVLGILLMITPGLQIIINTDIEAAMQSFATDFSLGGIIPYDFLIGFGDLSLGWIFLLAGGGLGLIGGILGPE